MDLSNLFNRIRTRAAFNPQGQPTQGVNLRAMAANSQAQPMTVNPQVNFGAMHPLVQRALLNQAATQDAAAAQPQTGGIDPQGLQQFQQLLQQRQAQQLNGMNPQQLQQFQQLIQAMRQRQALGQQAQPGFGMLSGTL